MLGVKQKKKKPDFAKVLFCDGGVITQLENRLDKRYSHFLLIIKASFLLCKTN